MHTTRPRNWLAAATLAAVLATGACSDDPAGPNPALIGTWTSTSLVAGGQDLSNQGVVVQVTFSSNDTYILVVAGDAGGVFCETGSSCTENGNLSFTTTTLTFDPGEEDEVTLNYSISGDVLTVTGNIDLIPVTFTFERD